MSRAGAPAALLGALYLVAATAAVLLPLLPLELAAETRVAPDLLFALTAAWVLRRPDSLPALAIVPVFLVADFLLGRPPGLWTALVLAATEVLRIQAAGQDGRPFLVEWLNFAVATGLMLAAMTLALTLALVPPPAPATLLELYAATLLAYPAVVLLLVFGLRVRAPQAAARSARLGRVG